MWNILTPVEVGEYTLVPVGASDHIKSRAVRSPPGRDVLGAAVGFHPGRPAFPGPMLVVGTVQYLAVFYLVKTHTRRWDCQAAASLEVVEHRPVDRLAGLLERQRLVEWRLTRRHLFFAGRYFGFPDGPHVQARQ